MGRVTWAALAVLLCACGGGGGAKDQRDVEACLGFTAPPGWTRAPLKTGGAGFALMAPTSYEYAGHPITDNFQFGFINSDGKSLKAYRDFLVDMMNKQGASETMQKGREVNQALNAAEVVDMKPTVSEISIGKDKGYKVESTLTIMLSGQPFTQKQTLVMFKIGDRIVQAMAGYRDGREAEIKPLADAFLASINFDQCEKNKIRPASP